MGILELFDSIEAKAGAEPSQNTASTPVEDGSGSSVQYEKNEFNEKRSADDLIITAFRKSFPPGAKSIPFNQEAMGAIKAGYPVRVWLGTVNGWAWWVRGEAEREKLLAEGAKEPIYTLGELAVIVNMGDQDVKNLHALKCRMGAVIRHAHLE